MSRFKLSQLSRVQDLNTDLNVKERATYTMGNKNLKFEIRNQFNACCRDGGLIITNDNIGKW